MTEISKTELETMFETLESRLLERVNASVSALREDISDDLEERFARLEKSNKRLKNKLKRIENDKGLASLARGSSSRRRASDVDRLNYEPPSSSIGNTLVPPIPGDRRGMVRRGSPFS